MIGASAHLLFFPPGPPQLFGQYKSGDAVDVLSMSELSRLIKDLLPDVTKGELQYFQTMLDMNGDGQISVKELTRTAELCWVGGGAGEWGQISVEELTRTAGLCRVGGRAGAGGGGRASITSSPRRVDTL